MKYFAAAALCAGLAAADGIAFPSPTTFSHTFSNTAAFESALGKVQTDINAYQTSIAAQPEFTAFVSALSSAAGSDFSNILDTATNGQNLYSISQVTGTPTWWTNLPTSAQSYFTSVYAAEVSIESKDWNGAAATPAPLYKAAAIAGAGAVAGAALLL